MQGLNFHEAESSWVCAAREQFPFFARNAGVVYFDNAATTQRPRQVIAAISEAYEQYFSNVHRGGHALAARTTERYEGARQSVRRFLNAAHAHEILFTSGTTAAINLVARSWGDANVGADDEILLTIMEHHSNLVPWQQLAERTGCRLRFAPVTDDGRLDVDAWSQLLTERTRLVAVTAVSNVLGTINPIGELVRRARAAGAGAASRRPSPRRRGAAPARARGARPRPRGRARRPGPRARARARARPPGSGR